MGRTYILFMRYLLPICLFICAPFMAISQDLDGLWKGSIQNDSTHHILQYEILISKQKGKYTGYSHTWFLINDQKFYGIKKIKVHVARDGKIVIEDEALIDNNYPVPLNENVRQLNILDFVATGTESKLDGIFVTNRTREFAPLTGRTILQRVDKSSTSDLVDYLQRSRKGNDFTAIK
jgi:hypothetical protein